MILVTEKTEPSFRKMSCNTVRDGHETHIYLILLLSRWVKASLSLSLSPCLCRRITQQRLLEMSGNYMASCPSIMTIQVSIQKLDGPYHSIYLIELVKAFGHPCSWCGTSIHPSTSTSTDAGIDCIKTYRSTITRIVYWIEPTSILSLESSNRILFKLEGPQSKLYDLPQLEILA